jgi:signal transduction histidine kinase
MAGQIDALVAAAIHDAKNALMHLDTQLAEMACRPTSADFSAARATTSRIAGQLTELLTLYRAQGGQLRLAIDDHDLPDFIDDLIAELGPPPGGIQLDCHLDAANQLGAWAFDAYLVKLALLDALRNAWRHARSRVTFTLHPAAQGGLCFEVADDGPGFPAAMLNGETAASSQGTGLGLSFARLIAARHATPAGKHGHVALANRPGASFILTLP